MKRSFKIFVQLFFLPFPWIIRKIVLTTILNVKFEKGAKIGYSVFLARKSVLRENSIIKNFTFVNEIDFFEMGAFSKIGNRNWITGSSSELQKGYGASPNRKCEFIIGEHTRITAHHHFDCNGGVYIGDFSTIAGNRSQILTHSIDIKSSTQTANSVQIGDYCFIGTGCILLMNSSIPSYSVLGAGSTIVKPFDKKYSLYAGNPAKFIKDLDKDYKYFKRQHGNVS